MKTRKLEPDYERQNAEYVLPIISWTLINYQSL
jgi:hypothetical protein